MGVTRQGGFWIAVGAAALIVLYLIHSILLPFVVGAVGAYLLVPVVDRLEYWGMNRSFATLSVVGLFAVVIGRFDKLHTLSGSRNRSPTFGMCSPCAVLAELAPCCSDGRRFHNWRSCR